MPGVKQLNEVADLYLEHSGFFDGKRNRSKKNIVRHQITKNLVMFVGMKFIVTERFVPDTSITQDGQLTDPNAKPAKAPRGAEERARFNADKKAKREREAEARKLNESQGRSSFYDETKNGQIEVSRGLIVPFLLSLRPPFHRLSKRFNKSPCLEVMAGPRLGWLPVSQKESAPEGPGF